MEFDREALKGIYHALSSAEQKEIAMYVGDKVRRAHGLVVDEDLHVVQAVMVAMGYIMPFEVSAVDIYAEEYEEIMEIQDIATVAQR